MAAITASLKSAAEYLGQLAHRGAFDQYARYSPGEVVTDGGATYVNVAPVGAAPFMVDTFDRQGAASWGTSESGHAWQSSNAFASTLRPTIEAGAGVLRSTAGGASDGQLWGPAAALGDAEMLVLAALGQAGDDLDQGLNCYLQADEINDSHAGVRIVVSTDGALEVNVLAIAPTEIEYLGGQETPEAVGFGPVSWVRVRRVGQTYSARVWQQGAPEPASWLVSHNVGYDVLPGHPTLQIDANGSVLTVSVYAVSVRALSGATVPGSDAAHWAPLATALSLASPQ